jgi:hypothetical protein
MPRTMFSKTTKTRVKRRDGSIKVKVESSTHKFVLSVCINCGTNYSDMGDESGLSWLCYPIK